MDDASEFLCPLLAGGPVSGEPSRSSTGVKCGHCLPCFLPTEVASLGQAGPLDSKQLLLQPSLPPGSAHFSFFSL